MVTEKLPTLNLGVMDRYSRAGFHERSPVRWEEFEAFLTSEAFAALYRDFPPLDLFVRQEGMARAFGQRPHDRFHLAYESSIYEGAEAGGGVVRHEQLPASWQAFIEELSGERYRRFIAELFEVEEFDIRFAWHAAFAGCEVSPHLDGPKKLGTQLFYFNTSADWDAGWGGSTAFLFGKKVERMNPECSDFERMVTTSIVDNRSCIFQNGPEAWHAVEPLTCPEGRYRRLFTVVFDRPKAWSAEEKAPVYEAKREKGPLGRLLSRLTGSK